MKKLLALFLALVLCFSLAACGDKNDGSLKDNQEKDKVTGQSIYYLGDDEDIAYLKDVENPLDPAQIYANMEYNEKMIHGTYYIEGRWDDYSDFWNDTPHMDLEHWYYNSMETWEMTVFPIEINVGPCYSKTARIDRSQNWAVLTFASGENGNVDIYCNYTVSGNTVTFTPVDYYEKIRDENYNLLSLEYTEGTDSLTYTFSISGFELTLSNEHGSCTMYSSARSDDGEVHFGGYPAIDTPLLDGLDSLISSLTSTYSSAYAIVDGEQIYPTTAIKLWEDGRVTIFWQEKLDDGTYEDHMHHMVYIACGSQAMILTDGETVYYYTETSISKETASLGQVMTPEEMGQLVELPESQVQEIVNTKADLLADLAAAFEANGVNVYINHNTGEISLDNTLLFEVSEYEISDAGKEYLKQCLDVYVSVVFNEKYSDFVSRIQIEGHTDTSGSYELNLDLSQKRADSVMNFCLSEEAGVDAAHVEALAQMVTAVGYSYDYPIYDDNGQVDMDASRRVSFRFIVKLGD